MASLFRARRPPDESKSGGKILSGRRRSQTASPYARPQSPLPLCLLPPPAPSPSQTRSPRWISGLISGAGKLISSVFGSDGSSSCSFASSSDYSSDGDFSSCPGEEGNFDASEELHGEGKELEVYSDCMGGSKDIIQVSVSKLAIEQLLMEETFSREECNRLINIIQSRVAVSPSMRLIQDSTGRKLSNRDTGTEMGSSGLLQYWTHGWDLRESVINSPSMEENKWLEEKKLASDTKQDLVRGPCSLKTDMLDQRSPFSSGSHILTSQPNRLHHLKDELTHATTTPPSLKVFERKYPSRRSQDGNEKLLPRSRSNALESPDSDKIHSPLDVMYSLQNTKEQDGIHHEHLAISSTKMLLVDLISDEDKAMTSEYVKFRENGLVSLCMMMILIVCLFFFMDLYFSNIWDLNLDIDLESFSKDMPPHTFSSEDEPQTCNYEKTSEPNDVSAIKRSAHLEDNVARESHDSTTMRSVKGMLNKPEPSTTRVRRKSKQCPTKENQP
ncbi:protein KAKU4-like isoform X9 [Canna indica]|uniref:Protein KAKU4-like isoform X9 n=1 Tax=Canna indica TaxID=4628 RepID=A0AAQ3Q059_9LILI|nr:protein KAKU4-like isoform X9 [Canna indica]